MYDGAWEGTVDAVFGWYTLGNAIRSQPCLHVINQMAQRRRRRALERHEEAVIGAAVGSCEVLIMQPTNYWKTELQQGRFDLARAIRPRYVYRGTMIAATSIAPITAIQFCVNGACLSALQSPDAAVSPVVSLLCGVTAGIASATVQSPCQLVEINQQKHGGTMVGIARRVIQTHGARTLWRGFSMTASREGIFCCAYISSAPLLGQVFHDRSSLGEGFATMAGALVAGAVAAVLTHPADTLKTRLQGDVFAPDGSGRIQNSNPRAAVAEMVRVGGGAAGALRQCYSGFLPRLVRIVACTLIYGKLNNVFSTFVAGPLK